MKRAKTILQVNTTLSLGSTGRIANEIGDLILKNNWESILAYGRGYRASDSQTIKIGTRLSITWHVILTRIFDMHGLGSWLATKLFIKKIKQLNVDLIHLHNLHGYYINYKVLFKYLDKSKVPVVWTLHDCWSFTGHCPFFDFTHCEKWKTECSKCPQLGDYPASLLFDRSRKNFLTKKKYFNLPENIHLVTVSEWSSNVLKESFLGNKAQQVLKNGIDLDVFKPTKSKFKESHCIESKFLILGVTNNWDRRKGFDDFIKLSEYLDSSFAIVLVGGFSTEQKASIPENFICIDKTHNITELIEIYSAADVFVNTTYEDNYPTTNLEALACGTPVITYNTGGSIESVTEKTGFIVDKGDIQQLYYRIKVIQENGEGFYRNNCRNSACKGFDKNKLFPAYLELYKTILGED